MMSVNRYSAAALAVAVCFCGVQAGLCAKLAVEASRGRTMPAAAASFGISRRLRAHSISYSDLKKKKPRRRRRGFLGFGCGPEERSVGTGRLCGCRLWAANPLARNMEKEVHSVFFLTEPDSGLLNAGALTSVARCHPPNSRWSYSSRIALERPFRAPRLGPETRGFFKRDV